MSTPETTIERSLSDLAPVPRSAIGPRSTTRATTFPKYVMTSATGTRISGASWVRDLTPSFLNTLRRWYSTVLALMNS